MFLDRDGGLHLVSGAEIPLEAVVHARGASAAWRVRREAATIRVEGFDGKERCQLEGRSSHPAVRGLASRGHYVVETPGARLSLSAPASDAKTPPPLPAEWG